MGEPSEQSDQPKPPGDVPFNLGVYGKRDEGALGPSDVIAIALTVIWLVGVAIYFLVLSPPLPETALGLVFTLLAVFLPIALLWIGASVVKSAALMREDAARMQASMQALQSQQQGGARDISEPADPGQRFEALAARQMRAQDATATFATSRSAANPPPLESTQPSLALGGHHPRPEPLSVTDFIGAMNFPSDENDRHGFGMLRRALRHPESGRLIRAAQDILTLLSQDGIYMDDLSPDHAHPNHWRDFAGGARGAEIAMLGGVKDENALAKVSDRMRNDPVFRDTAHHFLREFDRTFAKFETVATDGDIMQLAATRSSLAFMLLARASGTFD